VIMCTLTLRIQSRIWTIWYSTSRNYAYDFSTNFPGMMGFFNQKLVTSISRSVGAVL
jgi:hypothetical protein